MKPIVAMAQVVPRLSNMTIPVYREEAKSAQEYPIRTIACQIGVCLPMCANAAAIKKLGIKNAATADAATFGYASVR